MAVSIKIEGVDRLVRKLGAAEGVTHLVSPMRRALARLQRRMADYPPQRPGSRYVRGRGMADSNGVVRNLTSEQLGKRWTTRLDRAANGLRGRLGNNASYAPFVQSQRFQARIHQGRWQTDEQVMNQEAAGIVRDFQQAINRALDK